MRTWFLFLIRNRFSGSASAGRVGLAEPTAKAGFGETKDGYMSRPSGESRKAVAPEPCSWNDSAAESRMCSFGIYLCIVHEKGRCPGASVSGRPGPVFWPAIPFIRAGSTIRRPAVEMGCAGRPRERRSGSRSRTRTYDRAINSRLLYQLSYSGSPLRPIDPREAGVNPRKSGRIAGLLPYGVEHGTADRRPGAGGRT